MKKYPKHLILYGNSSNAFTAYNSDNYFVTVFDLGNNITIYEDLNKTYNTMNITLPNVTDDNFTTEGLKKYDVMRVYFKWFDTKVEAETASIEDMDLIFDGYIDTLPKSESKTKGRMYNEITCKSTGGLLYERNSSVKYFETNIYDLINISLERTSQYVKSYNIDTNISPNLYLKISESTNFGEVLDSIRKNYAIQVYQYGNGEMNIKLPSSFYTYDTAHIFDMKTNCFNANYGDVTQNIDCVIVCGLNVIGIAFDPISYQLKRGVLPENLKNNIVPNKTDLNPLILYRRDLYSTEDCQLVARQELLKRSKNYAITLTVHYDPNVKLGDIFILRNSQDVSENQLWIVKKKVIKINKQQGVICVITGYSNSISEFPEDILLSPEGILDTDILDLRNRSTSGVTLH